MSIEIIRAELKQAASMLDSLISDNTRLEKISAAAGAIATCFSNGGKIISCGNGGSMCDAMHFAEELSGQFRKPRKALPAMAVSDPSFISCAANDFGYPSVFSRHVQAFGRPGDILLAISTSGSSANVLSAAQAALDAGMSVISLTGKGGGPLAGLSGINIDIPHHFFADRIQEMHIKIIHIIIQLVEEKMGLS
jgi:D-sedoheptulose 7-phosphate isomerase